MAENENRGAVLKQIRNPLIFFALALLVVEAILGVVVATSGLTENHKFTMLILMIVSLLLIVGVVALITIKWPENLYEKIGKDLENARYLREFVNSDGFKDSVIDIIEKRAKPEHLEES